MKILSILLVFLNALSEDGVLNSGSYPAKVIGKFSGHFLPSICNRRNPASWNSSSLDFTPLYFKPVLRGKYCGHRTRPPYGLRGHEFSLPVIFENLSAKPAHPRLSFPFFVFPWPFHPWAAPVWWTRILPSNSLLPVIFENLNAKPAHPWLSFSILLFSRLFYEWLIVWAAHITQLNASY